MVYETHNDRLASAVVMAAEDANRHHGVLKVNGVLMNQREKKTRKCVCALSLVSISEKDRAMPP